MYSVAAGAAGVGLLALAQPAKAEIIYTPVHVDLGPGILQSYALDLANNGVTDFFINATFKESIDTSGGTSRLTVKAAAQGNGAVGYGRSIPPLPAGQLIGSSRKFNGFLMASLGTFIGTSFRVGGQWTNIKNHYLGLKFQMNGETHYGWARLSVSANRQTKLTATLTGYAFETTPDTPIVAGATSGADHALLRPESDLGKTAPSGPSLGALAAGALSISIWRREEERAA